MKRRNLLKIAVGAVLTPFVPSVLSAPLPKKSVWDGLVGAWCPHLDPRQPWIYKKDYIEFTICDEEMPK